MNNEHSCMDLTEKSLFSDRGLQIDPEVTFCSNSKWPHYPLMAPVVSVTSIEDFSNWQYVYHTVKQPVATPMGFTAHCHEKNLAGPRGSISRLSLLPSRSSPQFERVSVPSAFSSPPPSAPPVPEPAVPSSDAPHASWETSGDD